MKTLKLITCLLLLANITFAQIPPNTVVISGKVTDSQTNVPVPKQSIIVFAIDSVHKFFLSSEAITDSSGYYSFFLKVPDSLKAKVRVSTFDCNSQLNHYSFISDTAKKVTFNFSICVTNNNTCKALFNYYNCKNDPYKPINCNCYSSTFSFHNKSTGSNKNINWNFGDGTVTINQNDLCHQFPKEGGTFQVCLTVTEGSCKNTYCQNVKVDPIIPVPVVKNDTIIVEGKVTDKLTQAPVINYHVLLSAKDSSQKIVIKNYGQYTDSTGKYSWMIIKPDTLKIAYIVASLYDINNMYINKVIAASSLVQINFEIKALPEEKTCKAFFTSYNCKNDSTLLNNSDCSPLSITFHDKSTGIGSNSSLYWSFGDGYTSYNLKDFRHDYKKCGTYLVSLTIKDSTCQATYSQNVKVDSVLNPIIKNDTLIIKGNVINDQTKEPIINHLVFLTAKNSLRGSYESTKTLTDSLGNYIFKQKLFDTDTVQSTISIFTYDCNNVKKEVTFLTDSLLKIINFSICSTSVSNTCKAIFNYFNCIDDPAKPINCNCSKTTFSFHNISTGSNTKVNWNFGDGTIAINQNDLCHDFKKSGTYQVGLTVTEGTCKNTFYQNVKVNQIIPDTVRNIDSSKIKDVVLIISIQLDSCIIDYASEIDSAYISGINIVNNKIIVGWIIKQISGTKHIYATYNFTKTGLILFYLTIQCNDGKIKSIHSTTFADMYNVQLTGLSETKENIGVFSYPNPVNDKLNIDLTLEKKEKIQLIILNQLGQNIYSANEIKESGKNVISINTEELSEGLYFIQVRTEENKTYTRKFIKSK